VCSFQLLAAASLPNSYKGASAPSEAQREFTLVCEYLVSSPPSGQPNLKSISWKSAGGWLSTAMKAIHDRAHCVDISTSGLGSCNLQSFILALSAARQSCSKTHHSISGKGFSPAG